MKVRIKGIEIAHGTKIIDNEYYENYLYEKFGQEVERTRKFFTEVIGRDKRTVNEGNTGLDLSFEAVDRVLENCNVSGEDIDIILYCANIAEYICPVTGILIHEHIKGKVDAITSDLNGNCAGMTVATQLAYSYLMSNENYKHALVIGADNLIGMIGEDNVQETGQSGDVACAMLLEKYDGEDGFIDFETKIHSQKTDIRVFPIGGFDKFLRNPEAKRSELLVGTNNPEKNGVPFMGTDQISRMLEKHHYTIDDVAAICFSQIALSNNKQIEENLGFDPEKSIFVATKYGYTGTNSPFIALYEGIQKGQIKRGDLVVLWAIGAGTQISCILFKY